MEDEGEGPWEQAGGKGGDGQGTGAKGRRAWGRGQRAGADLAHEGLVGVAELAEVQQGLHHRLLQRRLRLLLCVLVPVDVAPGPCRQHRLQYHVQLGTCNHVAK